MARRNDNSLDYWKRREAEARKNTIEDEAEYKARIEEIYKYTAANIERQVNDWYARYAKENGMFMSEAKERVRKLDMERYEALAKKYVATHDFSDQANEEMALYNLTMRINRLELLKAQINLELLAGYDDIEHELERDLIETAMKEDRRLAGILGDSVIGNERYAAQLVNASFKNATFSERLWGNNMPALRVHLEAELRNGLIQGIHPRELARRFRRHYSGSVRDTERLMTTEMCRLQTAVQKESFERNGFTEYRFITAGDGHVCPVCEDLHGQHFKVSEMQPGDNAPPMHPSCRCSTAAWMDGDKYNRWIEALANGEDVRWRDFEPDNPEADNDVFTKAVKTLTRDKEDFERMSESAKVFASEKDLPKQMQLINNFLDGYVNNSSSWSGNVYIDDRMASWGKYKRKSGDIVLRTDSPLKTKIHELLHSRQIYQNENITPELRRKYKPIHEATTELATQLICKAERIDIFNPSYNKWVSKLVDITDILQISRMDFCISLIDTPIDSRYDWIRDKIEKAKENKKITQDGYEKAILCLDELK